MLQTSEFSMDFVQTVDNRQRAKAPKPSKRTIERERFVAGPYRALLTSLQMQAAKKVVIPDLVQPETENPLAGLQRYASRHNLILVLLEDLGISLAMFAMNSIVRSCPVDGQLAETVIYYREPVTGNPGTLTDRYFKDEENAYCHIRCFNKEGVANELEQTFETTTGIRVHLHRLNPNSDVKITLVSADGTIGCTISVPALHVQNVLKLIK